MRSSGDLVKYDANGYPTIEIMHMEFDRVYDVEIHGEPFTICLNRDGILQVVGVVAEPPRAPLEA